MGAWIEISVKIDNTFKRAVAPHMGAWIEIFLSMGGVGNCLVAPHMGAWIEILVISLSFFMLSSHPTWVRGLKF